MKFLANENFPLASIKYLQGLGYDVKSIGQDYHGITDQEVLKIAIKEKRTILTFDRDYGEMIFKYNIKPENGVIYLRVFQYSAVELGILIDKLLSSRELNFENKLTVISSESIRQRKY